MALQNSVGESVNTALVANHKKWGRMSDQLSAKLFYRDSPPREACALAQRGSGYRTVVTGMGHGRNLSQWLLIFLRTNSAHGRHHHQQKKRHKHQHQQHYHHLGKSPIHLLSLHNCMFMQKYDYLCELEFETHLGVQICIRQTIDFLSFICNASARARLLGITAATVSRHDVWTVRL